ncbi:olfactory receptor 6N1-like [Alligator mississippiensis]|uniref:olfactory receptor 6N1-like n=1 Tax=Alligator mississippiensis TaxID=8496 RepID=UPI0003D0F3D6|nr:olfactory receptor 6N1-like [Alligator mississippiensis]
MAENILFTVLVVADHHLHTLMYFFLGNLSFLQTCYSSTILSRMLASLLTGDKTISVMGCIIQLSIFGFLGATECYLLAAMSYDRYIAICKPLHYVILMNGRICHQLAAGAWLSGFMGSAIMTILVTQLTFCGPSDTDHFFCDFTPLTKLSCSNASLVTLVTAVLSSVETLLPFVFTMETYVCIITTILKIPSTTGKQKAFSICSAHLLVVAMFYGTLILVYVIPKTSALIDLNKMFSLFYTVLTPVANPLVYSLRNKEIKESLRNIVSQCRTSRF